MTHEVLVSLKCLKNLYFIFLTKNSVNGLTQTVCTHYAYSRLLISIEETCSKI